MDVTSGLILVKKSQEDSLRAGGCHPPAPLSLLPPQVILWEMLAKVPWSGW